MKLIIQICCHNEAATLPQTLAELPRALPGFDRVEWLVIDDGSADGTGEVAKRGGVDHVIRLPQCHGLARAFEAGLTACLSRGADVIVHTDGDNQYAGACVADLVAPIVSGEAQVVIGDRPIESMEDFSALKKRLQRLGSWTMRRITGLDVPDATSGFRAYTREAALRLNVTSDFSYTLETLVAAAQQKLKVAHVPIRVHPATRPSRLFSSMWRFVGLQLITLLRVYTMYRPLRVFIGAGGLAILGGLILGARYLFYMVQGEGKGHVQSVIVAGLLLNVGVLLCMMGLLADTIRSNRLFLERILYRLRKREAAEEASREKNDRN